jgi:hypothetical protein
MVSILKYLDGAVGCKIMYGEQVISAVKMGNASEDEIRDERH